MPEGSGLYLGLHKRKSFEPESEVRCIFMKVPAIIPNPANLSKSIIDPSEKTPCGEYIDIDLNMLIEEIYISPYAAPYIKENVNLIANKFNITARVIQSKLFMLN